MENTDKMPAVSEEEKQKALAMANRYAETKDIADLLNFKTSNGLQEKFKENATPDDKEEKKVNKKIRKIWANYRQNLLDKIDLENYKKFCEIETMRAETDRKLAEIKRQREKEEAEHWLEMHKGNLKEIGYNTESVPNKYFYAIDRYIFYFKNRCKNIPKLTWYMMAGIAGLAVVFLLAVGLSKLV